jgi:putative ABC transport system substrate-binding protein
MFFIQPAKAQESPLVLLLSNQQSGPYNLTMEAFKDRLAQYLPQAEYMYHLTDKAANISASQFVSKDTKAPPAFIFSLGTKAATIAQSTFPDTPVLATMILQEKALDNKANKNVILVQFSVEVQLQWLQKFLPHVRRVGILYNPDQNSHWIKEAEKVSQGKNIEIVPFAINSAKQLKTGLKYISRNADVLLAIPDQTVYSGKTAKEVLLFSYRNRIPFIGLSASWVKAGALYALGVDYQDLGRQAAELANNVLAGKSVGKTPVYPEKIIYTLNSRTIDHLRLKINNDLIEGSAKVFD